MKIDVLKMIEELREETLKPYTDVEKIGTLAIIQVGDNPASNLYVKSKKKELAKWKIDIQHIHLDAYTTGFELTNIIRTLNEAKEINGIIVQLPLPEHLDEQLIINLIRPEKNVDGFKQTYSHKLMFEPCTPKGIMYILKKLRDVKGKTVCLLGRGKTVGAPLIEMLSKEPCTLICCNSNTDGITLKELLHQSDIVITAVGKPKTIVSYDLLYGTLVIDAGISYVDGKQTGDYDHHEGVGKNIDYTPHLGGVGKMTVAMLAANTIKAVEMQKG